ncbi:ferrous iron transport protein A [Ruminococcus sp. 5_1_39BFAA]|uniref:FeoA family protein n=1 Tax=Ruminococcus sp. 5_1_39BFAA TaxID=457412 RepID=UPI003563C7E2
MLALSQAKQGETYTVKWMFGVPEVLDFMRDCHIEEGSVIRVIGKSGNGLIVASKQKRVAICAEVAERIKV